MTYYHVLIETNEKIKDYNKRYFELDKTDLSEIKEDIIIPFLTSKRFQFNGYFLDPENIKRVIVRTSECTARVCAKHARENLPPNIIMAISSQDIVLDNKYTMDITKDVFKECQALLDKQGETNSKSTNAVEKIMDKSKVFIVHGHDTAAKAEAARLVEKLGFEAIILHEQASSGMTIIEKIETYSDVGFAIVLYTPCDLGAAKDKKDNLRGRARQNVVFEHGYLIGKIGRQNVCALVKGDIETPNDISGVVYVSMDEVGNWKYSIAKEMKKAGYSIDLNKI